MSPHHHHQASVSAGLHEVKHDGFRFQARRDAAGVRLLTRRGNDWSSRYPAVLEAARALKASSCQIDGELVVIDQNGLAVFSLPRRGERVNSAACLLAFDLLELDGGDLRPQPIERLRRPLASAARAS